MAIKDIQQSGLSGWKPAWGLPPQTTEVRLGIVVYQRWRYKTWGVDLKCLTLLKRVRLVWGERFLWPSIIFLSAKKGYKIMAYLEKRLGILRILNIALGKTIRDSSNEQKCSTKGSNS